MSYPSGGPGYPQQGGGQQHPNPASGAFPQQQAPSPAAPLNLALLLALAVTVLGLVQFFIGFSDEADAAGQVSIFLLVSGLLAALHALPRGPKTLPFAALFSVLGAFGGLDLIIGYGSGRDEVSVPGILTVVLILGILQMLVAVAALLFEHDVIKLPAAKPQQAPQAPYSQQFPQQGPQGPFGQQGQQGPAATQVQPFPGAGQQGQPGQQGEPSGPFAQPGGFQPPVTQPPGQQATTYAPQQGQFFQQPPSSSSESGQNPGTPPGGFGQQS